MTAFCGVFLLPKSCCLKLPPTPPPMLLLLLLLLSLQVMSADGSSADGAGSQWLKGRQRSAFPPNYIHSIDSTHMMMTALACR
jgi:hypothetical protein